MSSGRWSAFIEHNDFSYETCFEQYKPAKLGNPTVHLGLAHSLAIEYATPKEKELPAIAYRRNGYSLK